MGIGHLLGNAMSKVFTGKSLDNREERRFENDPVRELRHEAAKGEDAKRNLARFSSEIDAFRAATSQDFQAVYEGYQDLVDAYALINGLMVRTMPADAVKANSKLHYDARARSNCSRYHLCSQADLEHLKSSLIPIAERQSRALRLILEVWERHPLVGKLIDLCNAKERLKKYHDRWEGLLHIIVSLNEPTDIYHLKASEEFFAVMDNTKIDIESPSALSGRGYMHEVEALRVKALAAIDNWKAKTLGDIRGGLPFVKFG